MNALRDYAWMPEVCRGDFGARALCATPWRLELDGKAFTAATNGYRLLVVSGDYGYPPAPDEHAGLLTQAVHQVASRMYTTLAIDLRELRRFLTEHAGAAPAPCDSCNDTGEDRIKYGACTRCAGAWRESRRVTIASACFNALELIPVVARLAESSPNGTWITSGLPDAPHVLMGSRFGHRVDWRLIIMPLRLDELNRLAPVFDHTQRGPSGVPNA